MMKYASMALALLCCISTLSCSSDKNEEGPAGPTPLIRLYAGEAGPTSLEFTVTCVDAREAVYKLLLATDPVPSAQELFATGIQVNIADTDPISLTDLEEQTDYAVVAAARNGELFSEVQVLKMSTRPFDAVVEGTRAFGGYYANELTGGRNGHYSLNISDIVWEDDVATSAGYQFMLSMHSDMAADAAHAEPVAGTYTVDLSSSYDTFTIDNRYTVWSKTDDAGMQLGSGTLTEGTMSLEKLQDGTYRVTARLTTDEGDRCKVSWNGPIEWTDQTTPPRTSQHLEARHAIVEYYGANAKTNPDSDLWMIELYDDLNFAKQGMFIQWYTPEADDPLNPELPTGTFTVGAQDDTSAWHFTPGDILLTQQTGTYLIVKVNGDQQDYYCTGGKIEVTKEGDQYTIDCQLLTNEFLSVTGGYTGTIDVVNQFKPLVQQDMTVECDRIYPNSLDYYELSKSSNFCFKLCDTQFTVPGVPDNGGPANVVTFDLYTEVVSTNGIPVIPDGTYTVGGMNAGQMARNFTFGNYYNDKGRKSQNIYFKGGTLTVTYTEGIYTLVLDCETDQGYKYVCHYTGELPFPAQGMAGVAPANKDPFGLLPVTSSRAKFATWSALRATVTPMRVDASGRLLLQDAL